MRSDAVEGFPLVLLHNNVAVSPDREREFSAGGIALPPVSQDAPRKGVVVAVGPGLRLDSGATAPARVRVGDRVLFSRIWGSDIEVDGQPIKVGPEDDVDSYVVGLHAVVEGDDRSLERPWLPIAGAIPELSEDDVRAMLVASKAEAMTAAMEALTIDDIAAVCDRVIDSTPEETEYAIDLVGARGAGPDF